MYRESVHYRRQSEEKYRARYDIKNVSVYFIPEHISYAPYHVRRYERKGEIANYGAQNTQKYIFYFHRFSLFLRKIKNINEHKDKSNMKTVSTADFRSSSKPHILHTAQDKSTVGAGMHNHIAIQ